MVVVAMHALAVVAFFHPNPVGIAGAILLHYITLHFGTILCYHRMVSHRMFRPSGFFGHVLLTSAALAIEDGPITWARTHRLHHRYSDTENDPHSPTRGFFWAHVGWVFVRGVISGDHRNYTPDLERNPVMRFYERRHVWINFAFFGVVSAVLALFLTGGELLAALLWIFPVRIVTVWHSTWLVNSVTHVWGSQPTPTGDTSRNNRLVSLLTFGEGLHNNHHAQPWNPNFGALTRQIDTSYVVLRCMAALRLLRIRMRPTSVETA